MIIYRKATFHDVEAIHGLISGYAEKGLMLARARNLIYESLRDIVIAEEDGRIIGTGALHTIWDELAEVRALAVAPQVTKTGVGRQIVEVLTEEAHQLGVKKLFALTYQPGFFAKLGYRQVNKEELPHKIWKECINCAKFPNCDEIAMVKEFS